MKFIIAGAGISGLSQAYYLFKRFPKCKIQIYEKSQTIGGSIKSTNLNGVIVEEGPRSFRNSYTCKDIYALIDDIELTKDITPSAKLN